jgi:hypothetical protein
VKQLNVQQQARIMKLIDALWTRRGEYLKELAEYLEKRNRLVSEHQHLRLTLIDLRIGLKELRDAYLKARRSSTH